MTFEVVGEITAVETIASGTGVRLRRYLRRVYGPGRWRKLKGIATVRRPNGAVRRIEVHRGQKKQPAKPFALCVENSEKNAWLILGKVYRIIPDPKGAKDDLVRVVDESGEDYLYHKSHFVFVDFRKAVRRRILSLEFATA